MHAILLCDPSSLYDFLYLRDDAAAFILPARQIAAHTKEAAGLMPAI